MTVNLFKQDGKKVYRTIDIYIYIYMLFLKHDGKKGYDTINMQPCPIVDGLLKHGGKKVYHTKYAAVSQSGRFISTQWEEGVWYNWYLVLSRSGQFFKNTKRRCMMILICSRFLQWTVFLKHDGKKGYDTINMQPFLVVDDFFKTW